MRAWKVLCSLVLPALVAFPSSVGSSASIANACSIDGVPSLTVNGHDVTVNKVPPTGNNLRVWAPFVVPFSLHAGRNDVLAEIQQRVAMSAEGFARPWRWTFGDGTATVRGMRVHHVYKKPGLYKVTVEAYFASHKFWYTFDAVQIRVLKN
ncbi:MAG: hypothetical protein JWO42_2798 [Chloroflexi bacterium]|nr:hypothetical protein [Chloroflexota bacterium]